MLDLRPPALKEQAPRQRQKQRPPQLSTGTESGREVGVNAHGRPLPGQSTVVTVPEVGFARNLRMAARPLASPSTDGTRGLCTAPTRNGRKCRDGLAHAIQGEPSLKSILSGRRPAFCFPRWQGHPARSIAETSTPASSPEARFTGRLPARQVPPVTSHPEHGPRTPATPPPALQPPPHLGLLGLPSLSSLHLRRIRPRWMVPRRRAR